MAAYLHARQAEWTFSAHMHGKQSGPKCSHARQAEWALSAYMHGCF